MAIEPWAQRNIRWRESSETYRVQEMTSVFKVFNTGTKVMTEVYEHHIHLIYHRVTVSVLIRQ